MASTAFERQVHDQLPQFLRVALHAERLGRLEGRQLDAGVETGRTHQGTDIIHHRGQRHDLMHLRAWGG